MILCDFLYYLQVYCVSPRRFDFLNEIATFSSLYLMKHFLVANLYAIYSLQAVPSECKKQWKISTNGRRSQDKFNSFTASQFPKHVMLRIKNVRETNTDPFFLLFYPELYILLYMVPTLSYYS